jgi:hypothetical protein
MTKLKGLLTIINEEERKAASEVVKAIREWLCDECKYVFHDTSKDVRIACSCKCHQNDLDP